jgi:hypothetical protein
MSGRPPMLLEKISLTGVCCALLGRLGLAIQEGHTAAGCPQATFPTHIITTSRSDGKCAVKPHRKYSQDHGGCAHPTSASPHRWDKLPQTDVPVDGSSPSSLCRDIIAQVSKQGWAEAVLTCSPERNSDNSLYAKIPFFLSPAELAAARREVEISPVD